MADLGSSRDRPFLRLWGFHPISAKLGFVGFVLGFVEVVGSSLILSLGSLIFRAVRWICPGFVEFMGCSLNYCILKTNNIWIKRKLSLKNHEPNYQFSRSPSMGSLITGFCFLLEIRLLWNLFSGS